jgi:hypothetical protein
MRLQEGWVGVGLVGSSLVEVKVGGVSGGVSKS